MGKEEEYFKPFSAFASGFIYYDNLKKKMESKVAVGGGGIEIIMLVYLMNSHYSSHVNKQLFCLVADKHCFVSPIVLS